MPKTAIDMIRLKLKTEYTPVAGPGLIKFGGQWYDRATPLTETIIPEPLDDYEFINFKHELNLNKLEA